MNLRSWWKWKGENTVMNLATSLLWPRSSAIAVVVDKNRVLALDLGDYCSLPGGFSDKGESFEETTRREVKEETGIEIEIKRRLKEDINTSGGVEAYFLARKKGGSLNNGDGEGKPFWLELEEIGERRWRYNRDVGKLIEMTDDSHN